MTIVLLSVIGTVLGIWSLIPLLGVFVWAVFPTRRHARRKVTAR